MVQLCLWDMGYNPKLLISLIFFLSGNKLPHLVRIIPLRPAFQAVHVLTELTYSWMAGHKLIWVVGCVP